MTDTDRLAALLDDALRPYLALLRSPDDQNDKIIRGVTARLAAAGVTVAAQPASIRATSIDHCPLCDAFGGYVANDDGTLTFVPQPAPDALTCPHGAEWDGRIWTKVAQPAEFGGSLATVHCRNCDQWDDCPGLPRPAPDAPCAVCGYLRDSGTHDTAETCDAVRGPCLDPNRHHPYQSSQPAFCGPEPDSKSAKLLAAAREHGLCSCDPFGGPRPLGNGQDYHYVGCDHDPELRAAIKAIEENE